MEIIEKISKKFWSTRNNSNWNFMQDFKARFVRQRQYLLYFFVPQLTLSQTVLDLGCSNGSCSSFIISPYCKRVYGIDISPEFIREAEEFAKANKINANFQAIDISENSELPIEYYDHGMALGLFTCIVSDEVFKKIVKNFLRSIKPGGLIALKDSVGKNQRYHSTDSYAAKYRFKNKYIEEFEKNNCTLLVERQLGLEMTDDEIGSYFFILKKDDNANKKNEEYV